MTSKTFFESVEAIAEERALPIEYILSKVEVAMGVACRDEIHTGDIKLDVDFEKKRIKVYEHKYVVSELTEGNKGEILLEEAKLIKKSAKIGDDLRSEIDFSKLGRKQVSKFKNTFNNEIRLLEREEAYQFFSERVGEVINATVIDTNNRFVTFNIGKGTFASMPITELIGQETLENGSQVKVFINKVEKTTKGPKVFITRSSKDMVKKIFENAIPEIMDGSIEIMGLAREAGSRTKIGVMATKPNLDPKGACVGQGGLRIKAINTALNNEKIDIFTWKENPVDLIAEALLPARSLSVVIQDEKEKKALVIVRDDQYSLAIGKAGQNVRLAAYAIDWKIDIKSLSQALSEGISFSYNVIQKL